MPSSARDPSLPLQPGSDSGTTAVVALIRGKQLVVANAGDSRCVVSVGGRALDMSYDHKPEDYMELTRIRNAGGKVTLDGRVNGGLNLSRAIGKEEEEPGFFFWPLSLSVADYFVANFIFHSIVSFQVLLCLLPVVTFLCELGKADVIVMKRVSSLFKKEQNEEDYHTKPQSSVFQPTGSWNLLDRKGLTSFKSIC